MERLIQDIAKGARLDAVLDMITPEMALRLARAIETDRLKGGGLPHDTILASLRPRLREAEARLHRVPSPQRLICVAFEDLLINRQGAAKQRGRIDRASIGPVWHWLTEELEPEAWTAAEQKIRSKLLGAGVEFTVEDVAAFQAVSANAILRAIPTAGIDEGRPTPVVKRLGSAAIAADAYDMARMLLIAPRIHQLQGALAKPIAVLSDLDIEAIRDIWTEAQNDHPENAVYISFFMLGRLARPWEVLRLAGRLSGKLDDVLISRTDVGAVGELILADLEDCERALSALRIDTFQAKAALAPIAKFAVTSTGVVRELGIRRDGPWGKRLMAARAAIAEQTERLLERSPKVVLAALPMSRRAGLSLMARKTPDFSRPIDAAKVARATESATLIAGLKPHAVAGAFAGMLTKVEEQVGEFLRQYSLEMLDELREIGPELQANANDFAHLAINLTHILIGYEDAELLRRRVAAAQSLSGNPTLAA